MNFAFRSKSGFLWASVLFSFVLLGFSLVVGWLSPLSAQVPPTCSTPIECFTFGQQRLQQAQSEIRQQKTELQEKLKELEQVKSQIANLQGQFSSFNSTLNSAVQQAQSTANAAQITANGAVKNIDFFEIEAAVDTTVRSNDVVINFPDAVDAVVLQTLSNDSNQIIRASISRLNPTSFKVHFDGVNGNGHRWIPGLKFLGIKLRR